jgi:hypothetical protein
MGWHSERDWWVIYKCYEWSEPEFQNQTLPHHPISLIISLCPFFELCLLAAVPQHGTSIDAFRGGLTPSRLEQSDPLFSNPANGRFFYNIKKKSWPDPVFSQNKAPPPPPQLIPNACMGTSMADDIIWVSTLILFLAELMLLDSWFWFIPRSDLSDSVISGSRFPH